MMDAVFWWTGAAIWVAGLVAVTALAYVSGWTWAFVGAKRHGWTYLVTAKLARAYQCNPSQVYVAYARAWAAAKWKVQPDYKELHRFLRTISERLNEGSDDITEAVIENPEYGIPTSRRTDSQ